MKVKTNVGMVNGLVRITAGLAVLSWATAKLSRHEDEGCYLLAAVLGAMKVGEGIVRYCPLTDLMDGMKENNKNTDTQLTDEFLPYNPS
ncbi:YgaP family membrane protein [Bacillus massilinigeriensis]|uniref:YgaP family membrane protein n=1 Tax=Bacillus mediterraneensis TaxID=1805474 RepID=UPI0008F88806|nr:DUF2892 domain-containing protein [Bacillus mediterraneensis]